MLAGAFYLLTAVMTDTGPVQGYNDGLDAWGLDAAAFNAASRYREETNDRGERYVADGAYAWTRW